MFFPFSTDDDDFHDGVVCVYWWNEAVYNSGDEMMVNCKMWMLFMLFN